MNDRTPDFFPRSQASQTSRIATALAIILFVGLSVSACNIYSSSDRKSFNSNPGTSAKSASANRPQGATADTASGAPNNPSVGTSGLSLSDRTHCTQVESAAPLLLRGVDIVHAAEAWNIEQIDGNQSYRFVWARRSLESAGVVCLIEPLSDYELQHTLQQLPVLASHLSAALP